MLINLPKEAGNAQSNLWSLGSSPAVREVQKAEYSSRLLVNQATSVICETAHAVMNESARQLLKIQLSSLGTLHMRLARMDSIVPENDHSSLVAIEHEAMVVPNVWYDVIVNPEIKVPQVL